VHRRGLQLPAEQQPVNLIDAVGSDSCQDHWLGKANGPRNQDNRRRPVTKVAQRATQAEATPARMGPMRPGLDGLQIAGVLSHCPTSSVSRSGSVGD
jgi:hypothetical protein